MAKVVIGDDPHAGIPLGLFASETKTPIKPSFGQGSVAVQQEIEQQAKLARIKQLHQLAADWGTYRRLKSFIKAVRAAATELRAEVSPGTRDWLESAEKHLRTVDVIDGGKSLPEIPMRGRQ